MNFASYDTSEFFDEMFLPDGCARLGAHLLKERIESLPNGELLLRQEAAERHCCRCGITFNVYGDSAGTERIFPFDLVPRIVGPPNGTGSNAASSSGSTRSTCSSTTSTTIEDLKDSVVPRNSYAPPVLSGKRASASIRRAASGATSPAPTWCATATARSTCSKTTCAARRACPTSCENRDVMKRTFPAGLRGVSRSGRSTTTRSRLLRHAASRCARRRRARRASSCSRRASTTRPTSSTRFLAQQMGVELVEGRDLVVSGRLRLDAHDQGLRAGRRHLPAHRRRLSRSARRSAPTRCSASRA